jgi:hypothetical protein
LEILESKTKELEDTLEAAKAKIIQPATNKPCEANNTIEEGKEEEKKEESLNDQLVEDTVQGKMNSVNFLRHWLTMTVLVSVMPADNVTYRKTKAFKAMNRTEYIYSSTMEVIHEKYEKGKEIPLDDPQDSKKACRVPGDHVIIMFLLSGIFLTAGWGGITAPLLMEA